MPTSSGPNTLGEENLIFSFDSSNFPHAWGLTQLVPNSEFVQGGTAPYDHGCYASGYYLGPSTSSSMVSGTLRFTGGDLSNYYTTNPEYRGWDAGGIGNTGGNWMHYVILPSTLSASEDYIVETRARFVYVSKTGNGSVNPRFQIGRHYYEQYGINYNELGSEFKVLRFLFNGNSVPSGANEYFTFGCTSADAMVELDYLRVYRIDKAVGLKNLVTTGSVSLVSTSFNSSGQIVFDGTNDLINAGTDIPSQFGPTTEQFTIETIYKVPTTPLKNTAGSVLCRYRYTLNHIYNGNYAQFVYVNKGYDDNGSYSATSITAGLNPTGQWNHIVATYSKSGDSAFIKIYSNGVLGNSTTSTRLSTYPLSNLYIGHSDHLGGTYYDFEGNIEITKIYNRVLTDTEIQNNYKTIKRKYGI